MVNFFLISNLSLGQNISDSKISEADSLLSLKISSVTTDKLKEVRSTFWQVLNESDTLSDKWYKCFKVVAKSSRNLNDPDFLMDSLINMFDRIPQNEHNLLSKTHNYFAYTLTYLGRINLALGHYKKSIDNRLSLDSLNDQKRIVLMGTYYNASLTYSNLGDHLSAVKYINEAIKIAENYEHPNLCGYYADRGRYLYYDDKAIEAVEVYKRLLNVCPEKSFVYEYLVEALMLLDSLDKSKYYLDQLNQNINEGKFSQSCNYYPLLSDYYKKNGQLQDAISSLDNAMLLDQCMSYPRWANKHRVKLSQLLLDNNDLVRARQIANTAISSIFPFKDSLQEFTRPELTNELPDIWIIEGLLVNAEYYEQRYFDNNDSKYLEESEYYYDAIFDYFNQLRRAFEGKASQYRIGGYIYNVYIKLINFYLDLYLKNRSPEHLERAFNLMQRSNAFVLRNAISERKALELYNVPEEQVDEYLNTKNLASNPQSDSASSIKHLTALNLLENDLFDSYEGLESYYDEQIIGINEIQNSLDETELIINYIYAGDSTYALTFTSDKIKVFKLNSTNLDSLITDHYAYTSNSKKWNEIQYAQLSNRVCDLIVNDILNDDDFENISSLIIVPDGPIKNISFGALIPNPVGNRIKSTDYLISDLDIRYLFFPAQIRNKSIQFRQGKKFVGFGIEYTDTFLEEVVNEISTYSENNQNIRAFSMAKLPFADDEVLNAANILNGDAFINEAVTMNQLLDIIPDYQMIHISAHALLNNEDYLNSFVVLNKDDVHGYQLKYKDILNLNLKNKLIVLSACQTGIGAAIQGEGAMSLSRAFLQSGAEATLGSYWNAHDKSANDLMSLFYANLNSGMTKSRALQLAQMEYLTNDEISSPSGRQPFYWSPWVLYGNNDQIEYQSEIAEYVRNPLVISLLFILSFVLIYFVWRKVFIR